MGSNAILSVASGTIFGAALTAAGVYSPAMILGQMEFTDMHMLKVFMTASATSAIAIYASNRLNLTNTKPRTPSSTNLFFIPYDGNILGGVLIGCGMTLTGACPGTVLPQVATGVSTGPLVLSGCLLGGSLYSRFGRSLQRKVTDPKELANPTVHEKAGLSKGFAVLLYEGMCVAMVAGAEYVMPDEGRTFYPPVIGGLLIGASQAASLLLTKSTLGVSTAYEQFGDLFWWTVSTPSTASSQRKPRPSIKAVSFAVGTLLGSFALSRVVQIPAPARIPDISVLRAVAGGVMLAFGARMAGGCTSGHGLSGMSQLSVASMVSVAAMFGGGMGLAAVLKLAA